MASSKVPKEKPLNPAKITPRNIYAVLQAFLRRGRRNIAGFDVPLHMYEQILYRRFLVIQASPKCWESGSCIQCGCEILGKTMEDRGCENDPYCYPYMMDKEEWKRYKKYNKVKLFD